jgi:hypothetical protein
MLRLRVDEGAAAIGVVGVGSDHHGGLTKDIVRITCEEPIGSSRELSGTSRGRIEGDRSTTPTEEELTGAGAPSRHATGREGAVTVSNCRATSCHQRG